MNKPLDLSTLIRCLEVMADENSWSDNGNNYVLTDETERYPWEVATMALKIVSAAIVGTRWDDDAFGHDRISNQELPPHER